MNRNSLEPEVEWKELRAANERHDSQRHSVTMWPRAKYKGGFGYPPDPKKKRKRLITAIDQYGNITQELR